MAGTAGSGGLGALAIGGIATVAVVIGGVVAMQLGMFKGDPPVVDPVETAKLLPSITTDPVVSVEPDVAVVPEPANTNAQADDESQPDTVVKTDETSDRPVEHEAIAVTDVPEPVVIRDDAAQVDVVQQVPEQTETIADAPSVEESNDVAAEVVVADTADTVVDVVDTPPEQDVEAPVVAAVQQPAEDTQESAAPVAEDTSDQADTEVSVTETVSTDQLPVVEAAQIAEPVAASPDRVEEPAFVLSAPELDLVRFDADGAGLIAGRAQAGVQVSILLDGSVLDQFTVQDSGEFVSFTSIDPSTDPRVVSLQAMFDGQMVISDATFILAPRIPVAVAAIEETVEQPAPVVIAQAEIALDPKPENVAIVEGTPDTAAPVADEEMSPSVVVPAAVEEVTVAEAVPVSEQSTEVLKTIDAQKVADIGTDVVQSDDKLVGLADPADTTPQPVALPEPDVAPKPEPSPIAMAVLKTDADGVELVQPATPVAPELLGKVSLDLISYSDEGDVQLAGRAQPDALVRIYLDNSPVADIRAADTGQWKAQLSDIAPGIYTLRLDELDAKGTVLSRLETPFKRESPEALQAPTSPEGNPAKPAPPIRAVTVQKGDTLWAISRERYGDGLLYVRVFEANKQAIRDPDLIYPGQIFAIPE